MSWLTLQVIADLIDGELRGENRMVSGVFTDTRKPDSDALFFALQGPNFNAHEVVANAPVDIAAALVVERPVDHPATQIIVDDTRLALGRLAAAWRQRFSKPVIALTGSNGKTTVKEMMWSVLRRVGNPLVTAGNLNNDIGVPLTLLRLREEHDFAVIEMGANHPGEIASLTEMVRPDVALITNAAAAHLEGFGDLEGVASAKGEIFSGLDQSGVAVINADDQFASFWKTLAGNRRIITFGSSEGADVFIQDFSPPKIVVEKQNYPLNLTLYGRHNVMNAAAAMAALLAIDLKVDDILQGLENMLPVAGRLTLLQGAQGSRVIDDSYNANPTSVRAAIEVLANEPADKRILVLGDMAELGDAAEALHAEVGQVAKQAGIDYLFTYGALSAAAAEAFGENALSFLEQEQLIEHLRGVLDSNTVVLVKGSRMMRMDKVAVELSQDNNAKQQEHHHAA
ncbi:MAG TPA: UDP-N-acetylmuramoyl-tripeptide--D-alanyl-D-alanine ligase [Chromatiales bacterium]|nr:UDP-N-acetylmuramoyl-tripeptide--D-alanyl-D-alanine ligase [Thiotrichales bacterium]HIP69454.1 UDP-N-acetylmuramoyl-tripeptide--D-alanyl-D-alanine ligase [Chromatiales bacterium]